MDNLDSIKSAMQNQKLNVKVDVNKREKLEKKRIQASCHRLENASKLKTYNEFFDSDQWPIIKQSPDAYKIAFDETKKVFNERSFIYDSGSILYGHKGWEKLNDIQKHFVKEIDENKVKGIYRLGNLFVRYIGSTSGGTTQSDNPIWVENPNSWWWTEGNGGWGSNGGGGWGSDEDEN